MSSKFTLYLKDGTHEVIEGPTIVSAFASAGYSGSAAAVVDFYEHGDDHRHVWDEFKKEWVNKDRRQAATD